MSSTFLLDWLLTKGVIAAYLPEKKEEALCDVAKVFNPMQLFQDLSLGRSSPTLSSTKSLLRVNGCLSSVLLLGM